MNQRQLFKTLESDRFTGQLKLSDSTGQRWKFYLADGQIIYAMGGVHPVRRWRRIVALHCPKMAMRQFTWYADLTTIPATGLALGWQYALLNLWVERHDITPEQATKLIDAIVVEVLFDIALAAEVSEQLQPDPSISIHPASTPLGVISPTVVIPRVERRWQAWQMAQLTFCSPHKAPVLRQPEQLQRHVPALYQTLSTLLRGRHTLYELAAHMNRHVVEVAASLLPCLERGWVELVNVADFPGPILQSAPTTLPRREADTLRIAPKLNESSSQANAPVAPQPVLPPSAPAPAANQRGLIACVDDSVLIHRMMETLLNEAGYGFVGIQDPMRAIGVLLARKPNLIFLDLVMPNANGYELCQQLRKLAGFRQTPIVILTGNDGYANRLRSNFAGATAFLAKPLDAEAVLDVIRQHLVPEAANSSPKDY